MLVSLHRKSEEIDIGFTSVAQAGDIGIPSGAQIPLVQVA
jgi:hypothetical protein